jgi:ABC-2 type transport system ATP-binding protein
MIGTVRIENLSKTYLAKQRQGLFKSKKRAVEALKDVSLDVKAGEIFGLLGPNGAGKTTLIKIITIFGLVMPFLGYFLYRKSEDAASRTGSLAEY